MNENAQKYINIMSYIFYLDKNIQGLQVDE